MLKWVSISQPGHNEEQAVTIAAFLRVFLVYPLPLVHMKTLTPNTYTIWITNHLSAYTLALLKTSSTLPTFFFSQRRNVQISVIHESSTSAFSLTIWVSVPYLSPLQWVAPRPICLYGSLLWQETAYTEITGPLTPKARQAWGDRTHKQTSI